MEKNLRVTLIDVGWGDSILVEASNTAEVSTRPKFMLVDSNDNDASFTPAYTFLKKHFGSREEELDPIDEKPFFEGVILSHDHSDHGSGLKRIMRQWGTHNFWYPKVVICDSSTLVFLQRYANHHMVDIDHESLDTDSPVFPFGDASMKVLWPEPDWIDEKNPNNNSLVLQFTLNDSSFILTGDAEGEVWDKISADIPENTLFFKVPHHGSKNGTVFKQKCPWLERVMQFPTKPHLGISCHPTYPGKYEFPHAEVLHVFEEVPMNYYRTDVHYHVTAEFSSTRGFSVKYSHA